MNRDEILVVKYGIGRRAVLLWAEKRRSVGPFGDSELRGLEFSYLVHAKDYKRRRKPGVRINCREEMRGQTEVAPLVFLPMIGVSSVFPEFVPLICRPLICPAP